MKRLGPLLLAGFAIMSSGCATYNYAQNVKTISFSDNLQKGQSTGNIIGEDCTWQILGYQLGGLPTVDRAMSNAQHQVDGGSLKGSVGGLKTSQNGLRYINNVSTKNTGFNAGIVAKQCILVTGLGFR